MRSEFDFIAKIKAMASRKDPTSEPNFKGVGDDCAVIPKDSQTDLLITADLLIEDVDFRRSWADPESLGRKSLSVSVSDIAAMGGRPKYSLLTLGGPEELWESGFTDSFMTSYLELAKGMGITLIGGDISKSPDRFTIDSIVIGEVEKGGAILRSGAAVGDLICVTGFLGGARAGLELLERGSSDGLIFTNLIRRQKEPEARVEESAALRSSGVVTSMIDISDGLIGDLRHLCEESEVGARVDIGSIPVDPEVQAAISAEALTETGSGTEYAIRGGEDFELLFTVERDGLEKLKASCPGLPFSVIGEMQSGSGKISLVAADGSEQSPDAFGFEHFGR